MNISRYSAAVFLAGALLAACGERREQAVKAASDSFRNEFIEAFTRSCLESIPADAGLATEQAQKICSCSAEKAVVTLSAADMPKLIQGDAEITARAMEAAKSCKDEVFGKKAASAASEASAGG